MTPIFWNPQKLKTSYSVCIDSETKTRFCRWKLNKKILILISIPHCFCQKMSFFINGFLFHSFHSGSYISQLQMSMLYFSIFNLFWPLWTTTFWSSIYFIYIFSNFPYFIIPINLYTGLYSEMKMVALGRDLNPLSLKKYSYKLLTKILSKIEFNSFNSVAI